MVSGIIRETIIKKQIIEFTYERLIRIAEPHILYTRNGILRLLVFQIRGQRESGKLPDWLDVLVSKIHNLRVLDEHFAGPRDTKSEMDRNYDTIVESVK